MWTRTSPVCNGASRSAGDAPVSWLNQASELEADGITAIWCQGPAGVAEGVRRCSSRRAVAVPANLSATALWRCDRTPAVGVAPASNFGAVNPAIAVGGDAAQWRFTPFQFVALRLAAAVVPQDGRTQHASSLDPAAPRHASARQWRVRRRPPTPRHLPVGDAHALPRPRRPSSRPDAAPTTAAAGAAP